MARLGDVCTFFSGTGFPNQYQGDASGKYPFFKVGDISRNVQIGRRILEHCDNYINDEIVKIIRGTVIPKGTVVFAKIGEALRLNRRAITPCKCLIDNNVMGLKPIDGVLTIEYFYYFMTALDLQKYCEATTVPSVRKSTLEKVEISVPSINEQNRITNILDKLSGLISLREQQLAKLDELVKARFVEMFGDPVRNSKNYPLKKGKDFFKLLNGKSVHEKKRQSYGIPAYGGNGISWYTDEALFQQDTLVIGRVGFQSGNVHFAKGPLWVTDNAMYIVEYNVDEYDLFFLYVLMEHIDFTRFQDAGDLKKITQKPFMQMNYICPPLPLQKEFVVFAEQVEKERLTIQESLDKMEVLKKSLMQEYFG